MSGTTYTYYEIPTVASPQTLTITLAGITYNLQLLFHNAYAALPGAPTGVATDDGSNIDTNIIGGWALDINAVNNNPIVCGIPLVTGIDLLYQYQYLNFGGALVVSTDGSLASPPSFTNLGTTGHLWFVVITSK